MSKYYSLTAINRKNATYNVIFGERSNGKTYAALKQGVIDYYKNGGQMAYVRRWKEDITGRRASRLFAALCENGEIQKITNNEFTGVHYWAGKWYLCTYDDNGKAIYSDQDIICFAFALSDGEHDKSTSFPKIQTIIFDEFLTNRIYLNDEFVLFMNTVSTIVRKRDDVKIYMLGNTVNKYCPYFVEMGLEHIQKQKQGTIDVYKYGDSKLTVAVEYCASVQDKNSPTVNKYFAFNNPKLEMITGGAWELSIYPHLPYKYKPKDVILTYYIEFNDNIYACEIIELGDLAFTYIHAKTTPIKDPDNQLIYTLEYNPKPNYNRNLFNPSNKAQSRVLWFFKHDKVFYQNNNIGDAIKNYIKTCARL
jgi:hypothetical protein